jgi:hypothetical protein
MSASNDNQAVNAEKSKGAAFVVMVHELDRVDFKQNMRRLGPASFMSVVFHCVLLGLFAVLAPKGIMAVETERKDDGEVATETQDDARKLLTSDFDPARTEPHQGINYSVDPNKAELSVPGKVNPDLEVGIMNGAKDALPTNLPSPPGFGPPGTGGALDGPVGNTTNAVG